MSNLKVTRPEQQADSSASISHRSEYHMNGKAGIIQGDPISRRIEIIMLSRPGFHLRIVARFVQSVTPFNSTIKVRKGETVVDGKSILGLLTLGIAWKEKMEIEVDGNDADQAVQAIDDFFSNQVN